ncbi:MAG: nucleotidyltransferase family protein [Ruminococcus sp.]|nr:nucleotidyltransferase family protein [Ruminococcus sp.]
MDNKTLFKYGRYMARLMACTINQTVPEAPFEGIDWKQFYRLANFHNMISLVYPAVKSLQLPPEVLKEWTYNNNRLMAREARQEIESKKVFDILAKENIPFIKMKGIVTKHFYPAPYMRTQADIDICMSEEHRRYCASFMEKLGYGIFSVTENTDEYMKDNFFFYEFHSTVNTSDSEFYELFSDPFSKVKASADGTGFVFTDEYFYLHLVTHLYKHFIIEGCGIRLLCDLYVYSKSHPNLDYDFIRKALEQYGVLRFYENIIQLNECLFCGKDFTDNMTEIAIFVFKCGDHGSNTIRRLTIDSDDRKNSFSRKSQLKLIAQIYFPGVKTLKYKYPMLEKAPVLLPFYWIRRGFETVFFKRDAIKTQSDVIKSVNTDEIREAQRVRELIDL